MSDRFLVDTDVLSAGAPSKAQVISQLIAWLDRNSERLYVSVVTIAEIEDGIAKSKRQGSTRKAARLREWLETLVHLYSPRILPFDLAAARIGGIHDCRKIIDRIHVANNLVRDARRGCRADHAR